jgi:hypothetical protein
MRLPSVLDPGPRLRIFAAITITATAVISFDSIRHLAEYAHFGKLAWIFPLTLDAVAAFGMDLWVTRSPAWKQARALALAAIIGSLIGNVVDHWISSKDLLPAVLGAVPPGMLAALLAVLHRHASGTASVRSGPDAAVRVVQDAVLTYTVPDRLVRPIGPTDPFVEFERNRDQFWNRVDVGTADECWPYQGSRTRDGYGIFYIGGKQYRAHRVAWSIANNQTVRSDLLVRHMRCDNRACCNPAHLGEGTHADNRADFSEKLRAVAAGEREKPREAKPTATRRKVVQPGAGDDVIVKWIRNQALDGGWPSKREVMAEHAVGSGRALRLLTLAKEIGTVEVATDE